MEAGATETASSAPSDSSPSVSSNASGPDGSSTSATEVSAQGQDSPQSENGSVVNNAAPAPKTYKVKVDGQEMEVPETELITNYQMRRASEQRFREALEHKKQSEALRSQLERFAQALQGDPESTLERILGDKFDQLAEARMLKRLQLANMKPEERQLMAEKQRAAQLEQELQQFRQQKEALEREKRIAPLREKWDTELTSALTSAGLPKTPATLRRSVELAQKANEDGISVTPAQIAELVREDLMSEQRTLLGSLDPEALFKYAGEEIVQKLRQYDVGRLKEPIAPIKSAKPETLEKPNKKLSKDEWREWVDKRIG